MDCNYIETLVRENEPLDLKDQKREYCAKFALNLITPVMATLSWLTSSPRWVRFIISKEFHFDQCQGISQPYSASGSMSEAHEHSKLESDSFPRDWGISLCRGGWAQQGNIHWGSMQEISLVRTRKLIFDESMILSFLQISQLPTSNPLGDSFFYLLPQIGQATCSQQNSFGQRSIDEADSIRSENGE